MLKVREATENDVEQIREIFLATYGEDYAYPQYYDVQLLKKMVFSDDTVLLVAEEVETGRVLGTSSLLLHIGAYADLVGEFGRLAVHPDCRGQGAGKLLMQGRLDRVKDRIHVGIVEPRVAHPFSQKISAKHGFACVGFLPMKLKLAGRESVSLYCRHFGEAVQLRKNNPRLIPEAYPLAELALAGCHLPVDAIVDDASPAYPYDDDFQLDALTTHGYSTLLRIERGRVRHREVFGPMQLHYGLFKIRAEHSNYLIARRGGGLVGAVGFTIDEIERAVRIFELISLSDEPTRFLLKQVEAAAREIGVEYLDIDVSAHAPRMQRTLLELGYLPTAYVPAAVFHDVERIDSVRMSRLLVPLDLTGVCLIDATRPVAEEVIRNFTAREVQPRIAEAIPRVPLLSGLNEEQAQRLAVTCDVRTFEAGEQLFAEGDQDAKSYIVLQGEVEILVRGTETVGKVLAGECVGETSLLLGRPHTATAVAKTKVETAVFDHDDLHRLIRLRPDVGVVLYRNLAGGIGEKLRRSDERLAEPS